MNTTELRRLALEACKGFEEIARRDREGAQRQQQKYDELLDILVGIEFGIDLELANGLPMWLIRDLACRYQRRAALDGNGGDVEDWEYMLIANCYRGEEVG